LKNNIRKIILQIINDLAYALSKLLGIEYFSKVILLCIIFLDLYSNHNTFYCFNHQGFNFHHSSTSASSLPSYSNARTVSIGSGGLLGRFLTKSLSLFCSKGSS
jgi:hypothetical protein